MRLRLKVFGSVLGLVVAVLAFGNWKQSPLHRHVCGPETPYAYNLRWLLNGRRTIDNWPAKLCGCTPPPGFAEHEEWVRSYLNGPDRFFGSNANAGVIHLLNSDIFKEEFAAAISGLRQSTPDAEAMVRFHLKDGRIIHEKSAPESPMTNRKGLGDTPASPKNEGSLR
jgi:hypothetical protein